MRARVPLLVRSWTQVRASWWRLSSGLWFVPATIVLGAVLLAVTLVEVERHYDPDLVERWPRLFGVGHDGAHAILTAIGTSMATVAGVLFSVTLVALSLAATQYSARVLRTFTGDRPTQIVLGMFVGIFVYCLVVLRMIPNADEEGFLPSLAVLGSLLLALVGIAFLVYFIHHLAESIDVSSILSKVARTTLGAVDDLFPADLGAPTEEPPSVELAIEHGPWTQVRARRTGYLIEVETDGLLAFAGQRGRVLRMEAGIGDFVIQGMTLASLQGSEPVSEADERDLDACYGFDEQRTIEQDAAFGLQQIVDIGSRALSPGINDASTAVLCIDRLTEILARLARRRIETPYRGAGADLRVIARGPTFAGLVDLAYHTLRQDASSKPLVLQRLLWSLERVAAATTDPERRRVLADQARRTADQARRADASQDYRELLARAEQLEQALRRSADGGDGGQRGRTAASLPFSS